MPEISKGNRRPLLRFNDIADRILEYNPDCDLSLLQRAYVFSAKVHDGQERLSGEPYLVHPLEVAGILVDLRLDVITVAAGLLHDTVEDTLTTTEEIRRLFGERGRLPRRGPHEDRQDRVHLRHPAAGRELPQDAGRDVRGHPHPADQARRPPAQHAHPQYMSEDSRGVIAQETLDIYAPLAHRLGIYWMKQELEELRLSGALPRPGSRLPSSKRSGLSKRQPREAYIEEVIDVLSGVLATSRAAGRGDRPH